MSAILSSADLLKAFSLWLPQSRHAELAAMWPPLETPDISQLANTHYHQ